MQSIGSWPSLKDRKWINQITRYAFVGLVSNGVAYLVYLLITWAGVVPAMAMSAVYLLCAVLGFFGNRKLTFHYSGRLMSSGARYAVAHILGYAINAGIFFLFVDCLNYPHQWVQAGAIFVVATYLFFAFRFFVFSSSNNDRVRMS
jgi:putative flippase GtrA